MLAFSRHRGWGPLVAAAAVALAYFWNLDRPLLWGDEAGTAVFARNLLNSWVPVAYDAHNVSIFGAGSELNHDLLVVKIPWLQFYVAAASIVAFGESAFGARALFALLGVACVFPLWAVLRGRTRWPAALTTLALLAPQALLLHRNARYYSIVTLLHCITLWVTLREWRSPWRRGAALAACHAAAFHAHPLAALATAVTFSALRWTQSAKQRWVDTAAAAMGLASWALWFWALGPLLVPPPSPFAGLAQDSLQWAGAVAHGVLGGLLEFDALNHGPLLAWAGVLAFALLRARPVLRSWWRDDFNRLVIAHVFVHVALVAVLARDQTDDRSGVTRYMPHLVAVGTIPLWTLLSSLIPRPALGLAAVLALASTNVATLAQWYRPFWTTSVDYQWSWWRPTYTELLDPPAETWDQLVEIVRSRTPAPGSEKRETIVLLPTWLQERAIFEFGDRLVNIPNLPPGGPAEQAFVAVLGRERLEWFRSPPKWIVMFHTRGGVPREGYRKYELEVRRLRPDDGTRPELTRHTFASDKPLGAAYLFERLE